MRQQTERQLLRYRRSKRIVVVQHRLQWHQVHILAAKRSVSRATRRLLAPQLSVHIQGVLVFDQIVAADENERESKVRERLRRSK